MLFLLNDTNHFKTKIWKRTVKNYQTNKHDETCVKKFHTELQVLKKFCEKLRRRD